MATPTLPFKLYQVVDDDGPLFVAARSFGDAILRWQQYHSDGDTGEGEEPNEVRLIANEYELLLPGAGERADG
jgi:hypothetical protein